MQKIELVVFDMAGTVVDENNVVYKTLQRAINKHGFLLSLNFVLEHGAGKEKLQAIKDIIKEHEGVSNDQLSNEIFKNFLILLEEAYKNLEVTSYVGVNKLIGILRKANIKIALNTGYNKETAQFLLNKMNWEKGVEYDVLITADDVKRGRPNPDMIFEAMNGFHINDASRVLKAGDSIIDIEEGKNAHCGITIGVTTGAHTREQLESAKPTYVLDSLAELDKYIGY